MARKKTREPAFAGDDITIVRLRKRLWKRYLRLGGWIALAAALGVNVGTVYRFVAYGMAPTDKRLARALGIKQHRPGRPKYKRSVWYWENLLRHK